MSEDMTHDNVDWVAVMFHAAKQIGAENKQLRQENKELELSLSWHQDALNAEAAFMEPIHRMYGEHPYASTRSLGAVIGEMVKLWEEDNIPF